MRQALLLALLFFAADARGIELSLEENRAQRGNIGYVDMQKVFKFFPETIRAKENFEEVVRQAEEQVNIRKTEIIRLRAEISLLRLDRELAARAAPAPLPAPPAVTISSPAVQASTQAAVLPPPALSTFTVSASSVPVSTFTISASSGPFKAVSPAVAGSTFAVAAATAPPLASALPGVPIPVISTAVAAVVLPPAAAIAALPPPPPNPLLAELDEKIAHKMKWLSQKEEEFKQHEAEAEKNLLDLESRKTEILLGKIHKAVKDVARQEGISVVVDKGGILFGQDAVDLTERVLKALKGL